MMVGTPISAPKGYLCLSKGESYYFLCSDESTNRIRLVLFSETDKYMRADLYTMQRVQFEAGLEEGLVVEASLGDRSPPWLRLSNGIDISFLELTRVAPKKSYEEMVDHRYMAIASLVQRSNEILESDKPNSIINAEAKSQSPKQNAGRLRFWFYSYLVFGRNKWALMPRLRNIGCPGQDKIQGQVKLGRPSSSGGYPISPEMKKIIENGFTTYNVKSKTDEEIYGDVLVGAFGCYSFKVDSGTVFVQPEGKPFPTRTQFEYWVKKSYGASTYNLARKGPGLVRSQSGSKGSFASMLSNVNQLVEFDGYYLVEKLSGLTEGSAVDGFCVVRGVCGRTGAVLGIGFAEGSENMEAYRMCLFSMAIDKVKYGELFGGRVKLGEWPCIGLPPNIIFDRGAGAGFKCKSEINWLGSFELTPVFSGQSKATVESSHPKNKKNMDSPAHKHSALNFVEMARREIYRAVKDNLESDARGRMDEEMILAGVLPTPLGVWNYLDGRGRNSGYTLPFDEAVRAFLTQSPATIKKDAVYFHGRKYRSQKLFETGVFDRVARGGVIKTVIYTMTMCVRHVWIDYEGRLYELDSVLSAGSISGSVDITLSKLQEIHRLRKQGFALLKNQRPAIDQEFKARFKEDTGKDWNSGELKLGRPVKNAAAQRDQDDYDIFLGKK